MLLLPARIGTKFLRHKPNAGIFQRSGPPRAGPGSRGRPSHRQARPGPRLATGAPGPPAADTHQPWCSRVHPARPPCALGAERAHLAPTRRGGRQNRTEKGRQQGPTAGRPIHSFQVCLQGDIWDFLPLVPRRWSGAPEGQSVLGTAQLRPPGYRERDGKTDTKDTRCPARSPAATCPRAGSSDPDLPRVPIFPPSYPSPTAPAFWG